MTDEVELAPDPFVRTALQLLPVPEHGPAFWAELDAALDAEPLPATRPIRRDGRRLLVAADGSAPGTAGPAGSPVAAITHATPDVALAVIPPALRRRSNVVLAVVAVAAAVMVAVAGATLVRQRAGDGTDAVEASGEEASDEQAASTSVPVAALTGAGAAAPTEAVLAWVAAVGAGDTDTAWDALGPASKEHFGSRGAFDTASTDLASTYAGWSSASADDALVTALQSSSDGALVVVTLVATDGDGAAGRRSAAFPVRLVDGEPRVEPFAFAGELEIVVPEPPRADGTRPKVRADDDLVVVVPRGVTATTLRLDDGAPVVCGAGDETELAELEDAPGQRCSYHPAGGIRAGTHVLTVAFVAPDGAGVVAESVVFAAA